MSTATSLFLGGVSFDATDDDLRALCQRLGLAPLAVRMGQRDGHPAGFAHVEFRTAIEAADAMMLLAGVDLMGRELRVSPAREKPRRERRP